MKRSFSNSDTTTITIKNKLFDALVKPILLCGCEIWEPELLSYKTHFDKSTIEQVHIKFCKQALNTPWYTENIACRAELGRYPLSTDIKAVKASIFSYWLRLQHKTANPLLKEAFHHARNHSQFFDVLNKDETIRMHSTSNIASQQHIKNARSSIKKQLKKGLHSKLAEGSQQHFRRLQREIYTQRKQIRLPIGRLSQDYQKPST